MWVINNQNGNELYHYGVEGMKWGVRRYQNADGTLTAEGRSHYKVGQGRLYSKKQSSDVVKNLNKWNNAVDKNWYKSYNNATDRFNKGIVDINKKYEGKINLSDSTKQKENLKYIKELTAFWKDVYADELLSDFGLDPYYESMDWLNGVPMYTQYE